MKSSYLKSYYLTFGQQYRREFHAASPKIHPDSYIRVIAESCEKARDLVFKHIGRSWSNLYHRSDMEFDYYPRGELGTIDSENGLVIND